MTGDDLAAEMPPFDPADWRPDIRKAWHHFRLLLNDRENTAEVFHIFDALPWRGMPIAAERFAASPAGAALIRAEPLLAPMLDDHATLRRMPAGSLAQHYCDFMERERLTAQGLVDHHASFSSERPRSSPALQWYIDRLRDVHDLLHVLGGYGRDPLGEVCVLAFSYGQQPAPAHLFIAYAGGWQIRSETGGRVPVFAAIREGQRLGKACSRLAELSIAALLPLPIEAARRRLNIAPARRYGEVHAAMRAAGIDPFALVAAKAA